MISEVGWGASLIALPIVNYYIRDFRHVQLMTFVYEILVMALIWTVPESPRWLLTHNRFDEASDVIRTVAKKNSDTHDDVIDAKLILLKR